MVANGGHVLREVSSIRLDAVGTFGGHFLKKTPPKIEASSKTQIARSKHPSGRFFYFKKKRKNKGSEKILTGNFDANPLIIKELTHRSSLLIHNSSLPKPTT
jgi:hypothetical protein